MQRLIYKICAREEWAAATRAGTYAGSTDDARDGFIHLSTAEQVPGTLARHFGGRSDLLLVAFDPAALGPALKWEPSRGGDLFPHVYGPLKPALALWIEPLAAGADGQSTVNRTLF